jgi:hypothetical protein
MTTQSTVKPSFTIPELQDDKLIEWNIHVTKDLGAHDMIIGHDILELLGVDIRFYDQTVQWGTKCMPFKDQDATPFDAYFINEDEMEEVSVRIRRILDANTKLPTLTMCAPNRSNSNKSKKRNSNSCCTSMKH